MGAIFLLTEKEYRAMAAKKEVPNKYPWMIEAERRIRLAERRAKYAKQKRAAKRVQR